MVAFCMVNHSVMTTTDSVENRDPRCPNGLRHFVHAAVVAGLTATLMLSRPVFADEPPRNTVAYGHYDAAVQARLDGNLQLALELLRKAWAEEHSALVAAKLAQTEFELGFYRDAVEHFEFYLQQPEPSLEDRAAVTRLLGEAKSKIVVLDIRVEPPGAEILVDRAVVGVAPLAQEIRVDPGKRVVEARKDGCTFKPVSVEFAPGAKQNLFFACERPEPPKPKIVEKTSTWKYWAVPAAAGVSVIGLVSGIVLRQKANDLSESAKSQLSTLEYATPTTMHPCGQNSPSWNHDGCGALRSTLEDKDLAFNLGTAGFVVAGVGFAGAVVLAAMPTRSRGKVNVAPVITGSVSGIVFGGSF